MTKQDESDTKIIETVQKRSSVDEHSENWKVLAEHIQAKVLKRGSDVSYLHTKAGFLIAASVVMLQIVSSFGKFDNPLMIIGVVAAAVLGLASLLLSIFSMMMNNSASPLNIDSMILDMHKGVMRGDTFSKWLVDCYNVANKEFNKVYTRKYRQQLAAAIMLVVSLIVMLTLKGFEIYG